MTHKDNGYTTPQHQNLRRAPCMTFTADGVPWSLKLISHARAEIEDARALRDSEVFLPHCPVNVPTFMLVQTIARLLITGRDALVKIQEKMAAKQAVSMSQLSLPSRAYALALSLSLPLQTPRGIRVRACAPFLF